MSYLKSITCRQGDYPHNARTRYTTGYYCRDCGKTISKGTLEYFMTEGISDVWMTLHNRNCAFNRGESKDALSAELTALMELTSDSAIQRALSESEAQVFMDRTYAMLETNKISDTEATKIIREA